MDKLLKDALTVETTLKDQIAVLTERLGEMDRAVAIWSREHAGPKVNFANDREAICWFLVMADIYENASPDPDKEYNDED